MQTKVMMYITPTGWFTALNFEVWRTRRAVRNQQGRDDEILRIYNEHSRLVGYALKRADSLIDKNGTVYPLKRQPRLRYQDIGELYV